MLQAFDDMIDFWIEELAQYSFDEICAKPSPNSWSLGQLYNHLISDTQFYIEQIKICVATNTHATKEASPSAKAMFLNNSLPDVDLEGSPDNAFITQPNNKEELIEALSNIKSKMNELSEVISTTSFNGKTKHPGLDYFGAKEWLQFAGMHFRHHLRQKKKIDNFLRGTNSSSATSSLFL